MIADRHNRPRPLVSRLEYGFDASIGRIANGVTAHGHDHASGRSFIGTIPHRQDCELACLCMGMIVRRGNHAAARLPISAFPRNADIRKARTRGVELADGETRGSCGVAQAGIMAAECGDRGTKLGAAPCDPGCVIFRAFIGQARPSPPRPIWSTAASRRESAVPCVWDRPPGAPAR